MRIKVEFCWSGGGRYSARLTFPCGSREFVTCESWNRRAASEALDIAVSLYGAKRKNVRFDVH